MASSCFTSTYYLSGVASNENAHACLTLANLLALQDPLYAPNYYLSLAGYRELTSQRVKKFVDQRFFSTSDYVRRPERFQASLESLSFCDYSLAIKSGVHFTLCGGTIAKLGTEKHHREILPKMDTLELPGCFGMTELGHGSNVMGIETTAEFDPSTEEFIIHTPNNEASKYWIGGAAQTAKICSVFAQLTVRNPSDGKGRWEGPHVFVVRLRDDEGNVMPGVRIADNGAKQGLNGVDNGQVRGLSRIDQEALKSETSISCIVYFFHAFEETLDKNKGLIEKY